MSKKTIALIVSLVVLTAALLMIALTAKQPIGTQSNQQNTDDTTRIQATPTPPMHTVLTLSPNPLNATTGTNEVSVEIDSGTNTISTVQLELAYDPKLITNVKITPGPYIPNAVEYINNNDVSTGRFSYALGVFPNQKSGEGKGVIAKITFNARPATALTKETEFTLLSKTAANQPGISVSVLKEAKGTKIILPTSGTAVPQQPASSTAPQSTTPPTQ